MTGIFGGSFNTAVLIFDLKVKSKKNDKKI